MLDSDQCDTEKIDDRNLSLERLAQPSVVGCLRVRTPEGIVDYFVPSKIWRCFALVVVPKPGARLWKDGLDREKVPHLLRLKDAALRIT